MSQEQLEEFVERGWTLLEGGFPCLRRPSRDGLFPVEVPLARCRP